MHLEIGGILCYIIDRKDESNEIDDSKGKKSLLKVKMKLPSLNQTVGQKPKE